MTNTPIPVPRGALHRRTFIPPLMIVPLVLYNIFAFTTYGGQPQGWSEGAIFSIGMVSGQTWSLSGGDLMLVLGLACLFVEVIKSTNTGRSSILEHMLSTVVFVIFLIEFLLIGAAASSCFFLLMIMSVVDVVAGFTISITGAGRDVTME
jgi:hypothetical protein